MKCAGCNAAADADAARYGKLWCTSCVISVEFEERLARQNGMVVADVFLDQAGRLAVLLDAENDRDLSRADYERVALTEADVLRELVDAMAAFTRSVVLIDDRIGFANGDAARCARQLLEVTTKYQPLLGAAERDATRSMQRLARIVLNGLVETPN